MAVQNQRPVSQKLIAGVGGLSKGVVGAGWDKTRFSIPNKKAGNSWH